MGVRSGFLLTCVAATLALGASPMTSVALAQSVAGASTGPDAWWYRGYLEAGWRGFLNNPQRDGVTSSGGKSLAKYYEYSTIKPGPFTDGQFVAGSKDGRYELDAWAKNVGYSDQRYLLNASKAGEHYFGFMWDQTPHVYSTSAQTIFNGVGTNNLTVPAGFGNNVYNAINAVAATNGLWPCLATSGTAGNNCNPAVVPTRTILSAGQANAIKSVLNANSHQTDIGIRRDTASFEYRYTPTDAWDVRASYANMSRTGTQIDGVVFSPGTSGVRVDAPKPVADTTQNYGASGEYAGTSFWGQKFNFKVGYNGSNYKDDNSYYTVQNPFCETVDVTGGCARPGSTSFQTALMSLPPDNQANSFTATLGAELPYKTRYMGTVTYNMMRQNQAFLPWTLNPAPLGWGLTGLGAPNLTSSLPASSLNGAINTMLVNNVLTTQFTSDLKGKLSYRYYDFQNDTPSILFPDWVVTDIARAGCAVACPQNNTGGTTASYAPVRNVNISYTKQNGGAELTWRPNRQWNVGGGYGYERYTYSGMDAVATNEHSGKFYTDWKPADWITARASVVVSQRRAENYNYIGQVGAIQWPTAGNTRYATGYRQYALDDRDRQRAQISMAFDIAPGVTVTPTAGLKFEDYKIDQSREEGLNHSNSNYYGIELTQVLNRDTAVLLAAMTEYRKQMITSASQLEPPFPAVSYYSADVQDRVSTFMASVSHALIPNKLDLRASYTIALSNNVQPLIFNNGTGPSAASGGQFPAVTSTLQRVDAQAKYTFDEETVRRLGWLGTVAIKARYAFERNSVQNWQNDSMQTYMYTAANIPANVGYMTWLAWNNPNYDVHLISGSIIFSW